MNLIEIVSGTIELGNDRWANLRRTLEVTLPCWIDEASFNGGKIQLFILSDHKAAEVKGEKFPAILALRAVRNRPQDNLKESMSGYRQVTEFDPYVYLDVLVERLQKVLEDSSQMRTFWAVMEQQTTPDKNIGQGDGCFRTYKVVFDTYYYDAFFKLFLSHKFTPA